MNMYNTIVDSPNAICDTKTDDQLQAPLEISIDDAIDKIGTGRFQHQLLFAAGTCFMADSMEIMLLSFLTLVLKREWDWNDDNGVTADTKLATITAMMFIGAMVGTTVLGPLGDRIGRKPVLFYAAFIISFFGIITAFCNQFLSLLFVRFMVGFGIGGLTVPFDILAEFIPTDNRGKYLLLIEYYWTLGSMLVPVIAYYAIEIKDSWRLFVVLCALPCFISLIAGIKFVPESPRWLIMKGRNEEALDVLRRAAMVNGQDPRELFPHGCTIKAEDGEEEASFKELFQPRWKRITLILFVVWGAFALCYYGSIMAITRIFLESQDNDDNNGDDDVKASFDYSAIFISSSAEIVGTALAIATVDRIGRIPTIVGSYLAGGVTVFTMCFFANQFGRSTLVVISFVARVCEMVASCTLWILTAELFSTEIRSTGHSAANAVARIGGFLSPYLVSGSAPLRIAGIVFLVVHFTAAFFTSRLPETKGVELGKATDESDERRNEVSLSRYQSSGAELI